MVVAVSGDALQVCKGRHGGLQLRYVFCKSVVAIYDMCLLYGGLRIGALLAFSTLLDLEHRCH